MGLILLGAAAVVAASVPQVQKKFIELFPIARADVLKFKVVRTTIPVTVVERGNLESAKNQDVISEVEGQTQIIKILPEGSPVKKDDIVCELDSASLRDTLTSQQITTRRAEADYFNALKTREVAEIAVTEYESGTFPQDLKSAEGDLKLALSELERAKERKEYSDRMLQIQYISASQAIADRMAMERAEIQVDNAQRRINVLKEYTRKKQLIELQANVEKAKSDELAKNQSLELEKTKENKLRTQIEKCILKAPSDGIIVYANEQNNMRGNTQPLIEEGATVRQNQKIFSLPDINNMQVNTKVHESMVDRVSPGLRARIKVDAFPNQVLTGTVKNIQPLPDPSSFFSSDIKVYTTIVTIDQGFSSLRPGMTAQVEILVKQLDNVLAIPVQSVLTMKGESFVFVMTPSGHSRRKVTLGTTNDRLIEVTEGLKEGEEVALNPMALLTEAERNDLKNSAQPPATSKDFGKEASPGSAKPGEKGAETAKAGAAEKSKAGRSGRGGGMGMDPEVQKIFAKLKSAVPQEQMKTLFMGSEEEKDALYKSAGLTDEETTKLKDFSRQMQERMQAGGFGGGGMGGPGGGGFGGGFGGGRPGGAGGPGGGGPTQ